jgi:hypothetical protein
VRHSHNQGKEEDMATSKNPERSVTRTYRAAIRLGEDYLTLEETINLPLNASDDDVQQAVDLGWRIYQAQREAVEQQLAAIREVQAHPTPIAIRDPDAPASEKQRHYIAALQEDLAWTREQLASYADDQGLDLVTLTKGDASTFIDDLKRLAEDRTRYAHEQERSRAVAEGSAPASEKQIQALLRLAEKHANDLEQETHRRFGVGLHELSAEQARSMISEWQPRTARSA